MNTAVQLRPAGEPRAELVHGTPSEIVEGRVGPVALFLCDQLVAYLIRHRRRRRLFVFRTLVVDDPLAAVVPGVRPRVQLLLELCSASRVRVARDLFAHLTKTGHVPSTLPDDFYLRLGVALGGRRPAREILLSFLPPPTASV